MQNQCAEIKLRAELALKLKPIIAEKAKERMMAGKADPTQKSAQGGETRDIVAKAAGVSHDTIAKAEYLDKHAAERKTLRKGITPALGKIIVLSMI